MRIHLVIKQSARISLYLRECFFPVHPPLIAWRYLCSQ